jgi:hypothetical protein
MLGLSHSYPIGQSLAEGDRFESLAGRAEWTCPIGFWRLRPHGFGNEPNKQKPLPVLDWRGSSIEAFDEPLAPKRAGNDDRSAVPSIGARHAGHAMQPPAPLPPIVSWVHTYPRTPKERCGHATGNRAGGSRIHLPEACVVHGCGAEHGSSPLPSCTPCRQQVRTSMTAKQGHPGTEFTWYF